MRDQLKLGVVVVSIGLFSSGCAQQLDSSYLKDTRTIPPIVVPQGTNPPVNEPYYTIPNASGLNGATPASIIPPGSNLGAYQSNHSAKKTAAGTSVSTNSSLPTPE